MTSNTDLCRRHVLLYAKDVIVHSTSTIETRRSAPGTSVVMPDDILFVRNNLSLPDPSIVANPGCWHLAIDAVHTPRIVTGVE